MSENRTASQSGPGRPVQVDQKALINKVLARYPGEFTLFRELLQNSDDAESNTAEIHFETASHNREDPNILKFSSSEIEIVQWTFKNNGKVFEEKDWSRLTRIAVGNPDPGKVGAFGVGFYSLFAVTDGPIVSSDGHTMEFYWKGDQLYFREDDHPKEDWTVFKVPLRAPAQMPGVTELMQFLATSITFMVHLKLVRLFLDEHCIGHIEKSGDSLDPVDLPITLRRPTPMDVKVVELQRHRFSVQAEISKAVAEFSIDNDSPSTGCHTEELGLTVFTLEADVKMGGKLSQELSRCMSKKPPPQIKYSLVYTGKDEYQQSTADQQHLSRMSMFQGLRADISLPSHAKIFIGHSTSQTTGIGGHMASHFIPTVERESIDLAERNVATWNSELLYIGGFLSRAVYELELSDIQTAWEKSNKTLGLGPPQEIQSRLRERFIHVLKFFTFHSSTPSPKVAQQLQDSFYTSTASPLRLLSSVGVRPASEIRLFDTQCDKFLKHVAMLAQDVTKSGEAFINALPSEHKIGTITIDDVVQDLSKHTLEEGELIAYLQWQISTPGMSEPLQVAQFRDADGMTIKLSSIQYFIDSSGLGTYIPQDGLFPKSLIPRQITKQFSPAQLAKFGWREFTIIDWLRYISKQEVRSADPTYDFTQSANWAERMLRSVSSAWSSMSDVSHVAKSILTNEKCIPTTCGLCLPKDSYLPSSNALVSDDGRFPVVHLSSSHGITAEMERLLKALGVKQHLPPQLLLQMVELGKWKTFHLIDYLVQVNDSLSDNDIHDLNSSDVFEGTQRGSNKTRFSIKELYPPIDSFRKLRLPLIDLGERSKWQDSSPEATLLYRLGLRRFPPLEVIMDLCSQDDAVGASAFDYLCNNLQSVYSGSDLDDFRDVTFVPAENNCGSCLENPGNVFLDKDWKVLGFSVIRCEQQENVLKNLGLQQHPPSSSLLERLKTNPPPSEQIARQWFEILSIHVSRSGFTEDELASLSRLPIVPKTTSQGQTLLTPVQCYLEKRTKPDLYPKLFHYVNFSKAACQFLRACGAKNEPSEEDIALSLIDDPKRFWDHTGFKRFMEELQDLATRHNRISNNTMSKMKRAPILLGSQRKNAKNGDEREDIYLLYEPREIVIVDDEQTSQLFADSIITAPRDMSRELQEFYVLLGCQHLTRVVQDRPKPLGEIHDNELSSEFQELVPQRLNLFLHIYPHPKRGPSAPRFSSANINIRVCEKLVVFQTLTIGDKDITKERNMSATAIYKDGMIHLWITECAKEDKFELAVSLCRILLGNENRRDAEWLTTCLSEERDVLERRGYMIDQAQQCKQCRNEWGFTGPVNSCISNHRDTPCCSEFDSTSELAVTDTDPDFASKYVRSDANQSHVLESSGAALKSSSSKMSLALTKVANGVRDAVGVAARAIVPNAKSSDTASVTPSPCHPRQVIRQPEIAKAVHESIQASSSGHPIGPDQFGDADMSDFLSDGYCNVFEQYEDLERLEPIDGVDFYVVRGNSYDMERRRDRLPHFMRVLTPIVGIFGLPKRSWCIFYDAATTCIAFNRLGTLYLNLRYFEVWHYQDVKRGHLRRALSSWFLTLAHEIAHNRVMDHNAEHEFWFWAVCGEHMDKFSQLLGSIPS